jgi:hypothetical protein
MSLRTLLSSSYSHSKYDFFLSFCVLRGRGVVGVVTIIAITIRIVITAGYKIIF